MKKNVFIVKRLSLPAQNIIYLLMKQYIITALDYADGLERRLNVRDAHLEGVKQLKENGNFIKAGAILNDEGQMIGSVMMLQFETPGELEEWQKNDPYTTAGVWEAVDIKPIKIADI
jgi:uncharacterized protein YciI